MSGRTNPESNGDLMPTPTAICLTKTGTWSDQKLSRVTMLLFLLAILMVIMQGLKEKTKMFVIYVVFAKKMAKSFQVDELFISQYIFGLQ